MTERETLKFQHKLGTDKGCVHTKFEGVQSHNRDSRGQKSAKEVNFERVHRGNYQY